jgi:hypothetical protein
MSILERVPLAETQDEQTSEIKRIVVSSVLGTAVEWYDFVIYGTASALVFKSCFFLYPILLWALSLPSEPTALVSSLARSAPRSSVILATGSVARPCSR